jgi:hypothetical protein
MSNIRPSNLPIEETDLIGFVHTDRGIDGSAKFNLANVSSALNLDGMATQAPSNVAITGGTIDGTTVGATTPSTVAATTGTFSGNVAVGSNAVTISTGGNVTAIDTVQVNSGTIRTTLTYDTGVAVIGSYTNHPVSLRVNQTQVGQLTTTGLNSTAIGATTPSTGAFTTVTATGAADTIIGSESGTGSGTGGGVIAATASANGNASFGWRTNGVNRWVMDTVGTSDSESVRIRKLGTGAASVGTFSSTGLAVTGALSSTGNATVGNAVAATNVTLNINGVVSKAARIVFQQSGADKWLIGNGPASEDNQFAIYNGVTGVHPIKINNTTDLTTIGAGLAVTGALSATGYIVGAGTNPGGLGGSKWIYDWFGGNHRQFSMGADASTNGAWVWYSQRSDGSNSVIPMTLTSTGLAVEGALSSTTGATFATSSGNVGIGTTSGVTNGGFSFEPNYNGTGISAAFFGHSSAGASSHQYCVFAYNGTSIGSITQNGTTAVLYNVTSDYRRKSNVKDLTGSGAFIDALKPRTFDWDTGDKGVGFIAHEFAEVSPLSVSGEKDSVDADGKPVYQSMQAGTAEVIANLVAELQSLRKRVAALESN